MKNLDLKEIQERAIIIRKKYHQLEIKHHGSEWTVEKDALAFLTDAGLVGRYTMSQQGTWLKPNTDAELKHKLGECMWWLTVLADRMDIDINESVDEFLTKSENLLGE